VISPEGGQLLYDAAGEPKELWYEPELGHTAFDTEFPGEFEDRVVGFFERYLLGSEALGDRGLAILAWILGAGRDLPGRPTQCVPS